MSVTIMIPTPLRKYTGGAEEVSAEGQTLKDILDTLGTQYDGLIERIVDDKGEIRRFINVFLNDEDVRFMDGPATPVSDGDVVSLIPAVAGG